MLSSCRHSSVFVQEDGIRPSWFTLEHEHCRHLKENVNIANGV